MRRTLLSTLLALSVVFTAMSAQANNSWRQSTFRMAEALAAGFVVVSTYHNSAGHLEFVLQHQHILLICQFAQQQTDLCVQLGDD